MSDNLKHIKGSSNPIQSKIVQNDHSSGATTSPEGENLICQKHVINLSENTPTTVPHTFEVDVCNYKAFDSLGNDIELSFTLNQTTMLLQACSSINLTNILIIVQGV